MFNESQADLAVQAALIAADWEVAPDIDAERECSLIARALYSVSEAANRRQEISRSEADEMRMILRTRFPHTFHSLSFIADLTLALNMGFVPTGDVNAEQVRAFVEDQNERRVSSMDKQRPQYSMDDNIPY